MPTSLTIACIIPARLQSTRFPQKVLATIHGKPMLQWVWRAAHATHRFSTVLIAVDDPKTEALVASFGGKSIMTSPHCQSGTDRLVEVMKTGSIQADIWVNWQADEPLISSSMIDDLLQSCSQNTSVDVWTLKKRIENRNEITAPNIAKVTCTDNGRALYFSRSPIPFYRDEKNETKKVYFKHVGIYAYTTKALQKIAQLSPCFMEKVECLEQLRFLENNLVIQVHETSQNVVGIDTPDDLHKVCSLLKNKLVDKNPLFYLQFCMFSKIKKNKK